MGDPLYVYKVTGPNGEAHIANNGFTWPLPRGKRPGKWMPKLDEAELELCQYGYHACKRKHLIEWLNARIFVVEFKGTVIKGDNKVVGAQARLVSEFKTWDDRTARLFACDCAKRVLPIYEKRYPDDKRPREAINTARRFANGKATKPELAATRAATRAAWDAAGDAARAAARDAERDWQTKRLFEYLGGKRG